MKALRNYTIEMIWTAKGRAVADFVVDTSAYSSATIPRTTRTIMARTKREAMRLYREGHASLVERGKDYVFLNRARATVPQGAVTVTT